MLVGPGGEAVGSVSGGCVEGAVYELAQEVVGPARRSLQRYGVSDDDAFAVGPDLRRNPRRVRRAGRPARRSPSSGEVAADIEAGTSRWRSRPSSSTRTRPGRRAG